MIDSLKPGQTITCTIVKAPRTEDRQQTILRLMRKDADIRRGLRKAHRKRQQNLNVYNRGNRDWTSRETCGKIARCVSGESWSMAFTPDLARDLDSVKDYLKIKSA